MKIAISGEKIPVKKSGVGLMLDDVNYAFDGGLYAELLENRNFEAKTVKCEEGKIVVSAGGDHAWLPYPNASVSALKIKTDRPLHAENPHYLRVDTAGDGAGVSNGAYGGVSLAKGTEYRFSLWVRSYEYKNAALVGVYKDGAPVLEKKIKIKADGKWRRFAFKLKCKTAVSGAEFRFTLKRAGMVHINDFSLMPASAMLGVFRRDLVELLKEFKPAFLYFPGGRVVESAENTYRWKDSVGDPVRRRHNWNIWATHSEQFAHYGQSLGIGLFECLRLSEYLGAKPVPVVGAGESAEAVQDVADLVEFACGGTDTVWGKLRAELGHPAAFRVDTLAVCYREDLSEAENEARYTRFAEKLGALLPEITILPPRKLSAPHSAGDPAAGRWDGALAEAVSLVSAEGSGENAFPNAGQPAFARIGYAQSAPALVWFDADRAYGSASYHAQKLFSLCTGDWRYHTEAEGELHASATERDGVTYVKVVNPTEKEVEVEVESEEDIGSLTRFLLTSGEPDAYNTAEEPEKVIPRDVAPTAPRTATLPPYSFAVLVFRK